MEPIFTVKKIEQGWYWIYEYSNIESEYIEFDSCLIPTYELVTSNLKVLEVDHRMVIPVDSIVRVVVTEADRTYAVESPSLGVKVDAISGRFNQFDFLIKIPGVYYGQSYQICGADYSFMSVVIESAYKVKVMSWECDHSTEME